MTTRVMAIVLMIFSTFSLRSAKEVKAEDSPSQETNLPVALDTVVTHEVADSVITLRDKTVELKENLRDKVVLLEYQQKEIKRTQKKIDSLTQAGYCSSK